MTRNDLSDRPDLLAPLERYAGRKVLLGVSGGADSVGLLRALRLAGALVTVGHLDHRIRPDSDADAAWVRDLCATLGVPVQVEVADVPAVAAGRGENLEAVARRLRYSFLARAARRAGADVTLTAHTLGDQAETVLHQLLRGEHAPLGIAVRRGRLERPWLGVRRSHIERFLGELGQDWRDDPSNLDTSLTRNWLRHEVLPLLRSRFPAVDGALVALAGRASRDEEFLQQLAARIPAHADLNREPQALLARHVAAALRETGLRFTAEHVERLTEALRDGGTTHLTLPGAADVTVTDGRLHLKPRDWPRPETPGWPFVVRHRQPGDRIRLPGGTRKVSDVLTDRKVPREERDRVWLVADGQNVAWIGVDPPVWAEGAGPPDPWVPEMGRALALASEALAQGEVPVGAVVVCEGQVIAAARNTSREAGDMTRHAELDALREASRVRGTPYLTDCTLVVTLEPCPMCFGAAVESRVQRVVFGADNPKLGALGGVSDLSRVRWGHAPEVIRGVRARESAALLRAFFAQRRPPRP